MITFSEKCRCYFTPALFAKLQQADRLGRVSIMALFNYVMRKVWLHQTRIGLSLYDITGQGFLRESDLGKLHQPLNSKLNHQILLIWPVLRVRINLIGIRIWGATFGTRIKTYNKGTNYNLIKHSRNTRKQNIK